MECNAGTPSGDERVFQAAAHRSQYADLKTLFAGVFDEGLEDNLAARDLAVLIDEENGQGVHNVRLIELGLKLRQWWTGVTAF